MHTVLVCASLDQPTLPLLVSKLAERHGQAEADNSND